MKDRKNKRREIGNIYGEEKRNGSRRRKEIGTC